MSLEDLNPETQETADALTNLAETEGTELSEEVLDAIAGGKQKKIFRARIRPFHNVDPDGEVNTDPEGFSTGDHDTGDVIRVF